MQPLPEDPDALENGVEPAEFDPSIDERPQGSVRRAIMALTAYAALAVLASVRLDGKPRLVVWLFLGLFAVKTLLVVLKERSH